MTGIPIERLARECYEAIVRRRQERYADPTPTAWLDLSLSVRADYQAAAWAVVKALAETHEITPRREEAR